MSRIRFVLALAVLYSFASCQSQKGVANNGATRNEAPRGCPELSTEVRPKPLIVVSPEYTELARIKRVHGVVYVEADLDEHGKVTDARVVRGLDPDYGLHKACLAAALRCTYTPAFRNGVPVKTRYTYPVKF